MAVVTLIICRVHHNQGRCLVRHVISAVAVAATVLVLTGMTIGTGNAAPNLKGVFADNSTASCNYTASSGGTVAINSQSQALSATFHFDGAGGLTIELLSNTSNVPAGTRSTSTGSCSGAYLVDADNFVTTDVACDSQTIDGAGTGNTNHVPSIRDRLLKVGDELFRMPAGPPAEEVLIITTPGGTVTEFRKCSRVGAMHKMAH